MKSNHRNALIIDNGSDQNLGFKISYIDFIKNKEPKRYLTGTSL